MNIDFTLLLVLAVLVTGLIWLGDVVYWGPRRRGRSAGPEGAAAEPSAQSAAVAAPEPVLVEYSKSFFPVLALVLVLRSFLVEPFQIPSGSMLPTLQIGDFILVNKYHYGIRLPVLGTKVVALNEPQRGDVMVFKFPQEPSINYIKRVVGLPGDRIRYQNKVLYINGVAAPQELQAELPMQGQKLLAESLDGVKHQIYQDIGRARRPGEWVVPDGHYFMLGDNRDNSNDSRFWGFVPDQLIVGKAFAVWMHWESLFSLPSFKNNGPIE